jgi:hypothetical protein
MNSVTTVPQHESIVESAATAVTLRAQIRRIQEVMRDVMIKDVHYGQIPGTPKPTLYKPGAEVLGLTFHIAPYFTTEDLSTPDSVRYRVHCVGRHQGSGVDLGEGMGECSSDEAKYKWRAPVCDEEFAEAQLERRREKWTRSGGGPYKQKQIRTEWADIANTVLKMAAKRAHIAMILNVLAASDLFSQDLEDLPEEIVGDMGGQQRSARQNAPQRPRPTSSGGGGFINERMVKLLRVKLNDAEMSAEDVCLRFGVDSITKLPFDKMNDALAFIADQQHAAPASDAPTQDSTPPR